MAESDVERPGDAQSSWDSLPLTYRAANRRAVDHLPVKLLSAGYCILGQPLRTSGSPQELESLASLEHRSWEIDRLLDGWTGGKHRDNRRRVHEAIGVPYHDLDRVTGRPLKKFDRAQVKAAGAMLAKPGVVTALRDFRVALIGHNYVPAEDKPKLVESLRKRFAALTAAHKDRIVSLFTPMAPGADLILTQAACEFLQDAGHDRIVVVRAIPHEIVIEDLRFTLTRGREWNLNDSISGDRKPEISKAQSPDFCRAAAWARRRVEFAQPDARWLCERRLGGPRSAGFAYRRANAYLATHCNAIVAYNNPILVGAPGGVAEAVEWAEDPSTIPSEYRDTDKGKLRATVQVIVNWKVPWHLNGLQVNNQSSMPGRFFRLMATRIGPGAPPIAKDKAERAMDHAASCRFPRFIVRPAEFLRRTKSEGRVHSARRCLERLLPCLRVRS